MRPRYSLVVISLCLASLGEFATATTAQELSQPSPSPTPAASPSPGPTKQDSKPTIEASFERLEWRSIGPANMGGRTADVEGVPGDPNVVYVATASGGLWKQSRRCHLETDL